MGGFGALGDASRILTPAFGCAIVTKMADVTLTPEALEQAGRLPKPIHARVLALVERLKNWPEVSGAKALSGELAGWYRLRTGDYRVRFRVQGQKVTIDKIGHRRNVYDD